MKKLLSVIISVILIFSALPLCVNADFVPKEPLSVTDGIEALRSQFESGEGPKEGLMSLDYRYYSPVGTEDTNKYPLVIFLHGIGHGDREGSQLNDSDMPYWSSKEFQERFDNAGGAFILLPRAPEELNLYWSEDFIKPLRALIDDFIAQHRENIDTTRISITGSSAGGGMVWFMLEAFPEYFASAFPIASTETPTLSVVKGAADTSIWLIASKKDPLVNYNLVTLHIWDMIKKYNHNVPNCRLSTFGTVYNPDGTKSSDNHHLAGVITYDLHTHNEENYPELETIDGNGNIVDLTPPNGLIKWISNTYSDYDGTPSDGDGEMFYSLFERIISSIRNFFFHIVHIIQVMLGL